MNERGEKTEVRKLVFLLFFLAKIELGVYYSFWANKPLIEGGLDQHFLELCGHGLPPDALLGQQLQLPLQPFAAPSL